MVLQHGSVNVATDPNSHGYEQCKVTNLPNLHVWAMGENQKPSQPAGLIPGPSFSKATV